MSTKAGFSTAGDAASLDYFGLAIDTDSTTHAVWGEGRNYKSPGSIWYTRGR